MADNSYAQLIDDYENGILVEPGETLTQYIDRMGGVDYKADGGSIGIEVLFQPKREEYQTGGRTFDSRATTQDYTNALKNVSAGTTYQQQADAKKYARNEAANELRAAIQGGGIDSFLGGAGLSNYRSMFPNDRAGTNRQGDFTGTYNARKEQLLDALMNKKLQFTSYAPPPPPTDSLTGMLESQMLPNMADGSMKSLAEQNAIRDRVLAAQKAQEESYYLTDPISGKKYTSQDEAINDLGLVTYNQRFADGGRVGLFMGGDPLTGQALSIYDSMKAYNFSDQEIANALSAQGLYTAGGGGGGGGEQETGIINKNINTFSGGDGITSIAPGTLQKQYQAQLNNPINNYLYEMGAKYKASDFGKKVGNIGSMAMGALTGIPGLGFLLDKIGQPGFNRGNIREMNTPKTLDATKFSDTSGINTDFGGVAVDDLGRIVQTGDYLTAENVMAGYNTGFDLTGTAFDRIDKINAAAKKRKVPVSPYNLQKIKALKDFAASSAKSRKDALQAEIERAQKIKDDAAREAATQAARVRSISEGYGGHDNSPGATGPTAAGAGMGVGGGYASDYGFLKDGGLATMFKNKR